MDKKKIAVFAGIGCIVLVLLGAGVIGMVAAIAMPKLMAAVEKAKCGAACGDIGAYNSALALYQVDVRSKEYPQDLHQLVSDDVSGWSGPYVARITEDPWGGDYIYTSNGSTYTLQVVHDSEYDKSETIRYCINTGVMETLP